MVLIANKWKQRVRAGVVQSSHRATVTRRLAFSATLISLAVTLPASWAQSVKPEKQEPAMTNRLPEVGSAVDDVEIFDEAGKPFSTGGLKGRYTVLVFGCLT
jgi:cytochrome oxidase Cu insertion factor (SCO1/SenC/PrrC family)